MLGPMDYKAAVEWPCRLEEWERIPFPAFIHRPLDNMPFVRLVPAPDSSNAASVPCQLLTQNRRPALKPIHNWPMANALGRLSAGLEGYLDIPQAADPKKLLLTPASLEPEWYFIVTDYYREPFAPYHQRRRLVEGILAHCHDNRVFAAGTQKLWAPSRLEVMACRYDELVVYPEDYPYVHTPSRYRVRIPEILTGTVVNVFAGGLLVQEPTHCRTFEVTKGLLPVNSSLIGRRILFETYADGNYYIAIR